MTKKLDNIDRLITRASESYREYRRWFDQVHAEQSKALMRTALTMITNFDYNDGRLTDHEYEQRLVFIMSANIEALRQELLS
jgi:cytochrome P450